MTGWKRRRYVNTAAIKGGTVTRFLFLERVYIYAQDLSNRTTSSLVFESFLIHVSTGIFMIFVRGLVESRRGKMARTFRFITVSYFFFFSRSLDILRDDRFWVFLSVPPYVSKFASLHVAFERAAQLASDCKLQASCERPRPSYEM